MTFLRFQEYYENPQWRNKIFTLGQFKDWYSREYGAFTYAEDWGGFNIPSYVLEPFKNGLFEPLTAEEQNLLDYFKHRTDDFYIIGVSEPDSTLDHEIAHGLYYTNSKYKNEVMRVLSQNNKNLKEVHSFVKGMMYHESVWLDEVHAYVSADYDYLVSKNIKLDKAVHEKLKSLRLKYLSS